MESWIGFEFGLASYLYFNDSILENFGYVVKGRRLLEKNKDTLNGNTFLFVIVLGFVGFFSAKSFHRYISLPASFLLLVLALFVSDQTGICKFFKLRFDIASN